jgi:hypothetical protein
MRTLSDGIRHLDLLERPGCWGSRIDRYADSPVHICKRDGHPCDENAEGDHCPRAGVDPKASEYVRDARGEIDYDSDE